MADNVTSLLQKMTAPAAEFQLTEDQLSKMLDVMIPSVCRSFPGAAAYNLKCSLDRPDSETWVYTITRPKHLG